MHDRAGVRPRAVDLAMDEPFEIERVAASVERIPLEVELHDIGGPHQRRRDTASQQEPVAVRRMADADVPEPVDHVLVEQDMICRHKLVDHARSVRHRTRRARF